jgi:hypothetical protein
MASGGEFTKRTFTPSTKLWDKVRIQCQGYKEFGNSTNSRAYNKREGHRCQLKRVQIEALMHTFSRRREEGSIVEMKSS